MIFNSRNPVWIEMPLLYIPNALAVYDVNIYINKRLANMLA